MNLLSSSLCALLQSIAISGGTLHPMDGTRPYVGTVIVTDGVISECGEEVQIPEGSQLIEAIAGELGVGASKVVFHPNLVGGSFGDKIYGDQVTIAAQACQVLGKPVKVMLTREDQFNFGHPKTISHQTSWYSEY